MFAGAVVKKQFLQVFPFGNGLDFPGKGRYVAAGKVGTAQMLECCRTQAKMRGEATLTAGLAGNDAGQQQTVWIECCWRGSWRSQHVAQQQ